MTAHIESRVEDIADIVIMPGDPLRAKRIAEKFLKNPVQVNSIRNMLAYTGDFEGHRITVFASGMGIPSIGIYAYELYKFYNVKKIIRVGSCGSLNPNVHIRDVVLAKSATADSNFAKLFSNDPRKTFKSSEILNQKIQKVAQDKNIILKIGDIITADVFDPYIHTDFASFIQNFESKEYLASEMEAYALFYLAELLEKDAACLLTVVDSKYEPNIKISAEERQTSLDEMIHLALLSAIQ